MCLAAHVPLDTAQAHFSDKPIGTKRDKQAGDQLGQKGTSTQQHRATLNPGYQQASSGWSLAVPTLFGYELFTPKLFLWRIFKVTKKLKE